MCIICIKKKGIKFPSREQVKTMCDNNNHGFSMVLSDGKGKPKIYKTLNEDKFLELYQRVLRDFDYRIASMYIHARIKTHGTLRIENCHGWKSDGLVFAHNGILQIANRDDLTDSETFFRDIFIPAYRVGGWKMGEKTIKAIIGSSKFVFMDNNGEIKHYGHYIEDDGLLFSNETYQDRRQRFARINRGHYWLPADTSDDWNRALNEDFAF